MLCTDQRELYVKNFPWLYLHKRLGEVVCLTVSGLVPLQVHGLKHPSQGYTPGQTWGIPVQELS